jgi:hypothetical protein
MRSGGRLMHSTRSRAREGGLSDAKLRAEHWRLLAVAPK